MCVIPVQICYPDSSKVRDTYVMLDNCRQGIFVMEEIIEALSVNWSRHYSDNEDTQWRNLQTTIVIENMRVAKLICSRNHKWITLHRA